MEPTANYHKPLAEYLIKCGCNVVQVSGVSVARNHNDLKSFNERFKNIAAIRIPFSFFISLDIVVASIPHS